MKKFTRIILILLAIFISVIIVAGVGLKLYFTSDRLKALVIPRIEEQIQRQVSVGKITLKVIPSISLELRNLTISNPEGQKFTQSELDKITKSLDTTQNNLFAYFLLIVIAGYIILTTTVFNRKE